MIKPAPSRITTLLCFLSLVGICVPVKVATADKLTVAEVVTKHVESIGPADVRTRASGMRIKGTAVVTARQGGSGEVSGEVLMASHGNQNLINMTFEAANSSAWLKFDGQKAAVSQFRPGARTALENFFASYDLIIKEGLVGGTLSESWPLLNLQQKNPKLEYSGLKKIGGKELHTIRYTPRKGSDLKIVLFFDPQTFQHVRTEYSQTIYANEQRRIGGGGPGLPPAQSQRATNTQINAFEEFSEFKPEGGLNLPHLYKFELSIQSEVRPALVDWIFNLTDFTFGLPLDLKDSSGN
jgi:hypothetical protein